MESALDLIGEALAAVQEQLSSENIHDNNNDRTLLKIFLPALTGSTADVAKPSVSTAGPGGRRQRLLKSILNK